MTQRYEPFAEPGPLPADRFTWSLAQAKVYAAWVEASVEKRAAYVIELLGVNARLEATSQLEVAQERAQAFLEGPDFSRWEFEQATPPIQRKILTSGGESLAMDLGFLLAKLLLRDLPGVFQWTIVRKPRRDINYSLPVLAYTLDGAPRVFNPLWFAIGTCTTALSDVRQIHALADVFRHFTGLHPRV